jgi:hypothetical protein
MHLKKTSCSCKKKAKIFVKLIRFASVNKAKLSGESAGEILSDPEVFPKGESKDLLIYSKLSGRALNTHSSVCG